MKKPSMVFVFDVKSIPKILNSLFSFYDYVIELAYISLNFSPLNAKRIIAIIP